MTFLVQQGDLEEQWLSTPLDVARWLCDHFGWRFDERFERLLPQFENLMPGRSLQHEDLGLTVERLWL